MFSIARFDTFTNTSAQHHTSLCSMTASDEAYLAKEEEDAHLHRYTCRGGSSDDLARSNHTRPMTDRQHKRNSAHRSVNATTTEQPTHESVRSTAEWTIAAASKARSHWLVPTVSTVAVAVSLGSGMLLCFSRLPSVSACLNPSFLLRRASLIHFIIQSAHQHSDTPRTNRANSLPVHLPPISPSTMSLRPCSFPHIPFY